jgi:hypothetical protein
MSLLFCLGIVKPLSLRTGLLLPTCFVWTYVLFLLSMSLLFLSFIFQKKKKKLGENMQNFFFFFRVAFQILYVFLPGISVHCALIEYAYI